MKNNKKWEVLLKSRDNNIFCFSTESYTEDEAKQNSLNRIRENGWEVFDYKIISVSLKFLCVSFCVSSLIECSLRTSIFNAEL